LSHHSSLFCYHTRTLTLFKVSVHAFALPVEQVIKPIVASTLQGEPRPDATSCLPVYLASGSASILSAYHYYPHQHPLQKPSRRAFPPPHHLATCSLIYITDTNNIPQPYNSQPHLYLFIDHPMRLFCHANPCIGICLIAPLRCWCFGRTHHDIPPMSFVMSSMHARFPLATIPLTPCLSCDFVGVARAVTFCNYCCNRIGFYYSARCSVSYPRILASFFYVD
jgi:hypothetical protein